MSKRYRLLKDLPDCKSGAIYSKGESDYICLSNMGKRSVCYPKEVVENNPEWFELIPDTSEQTTKEGFTWTDELVYDVVSQLIIKYKEAWLADPKAGTLFQKKWHGAEREIENLIQSKLSKQSRTPLFRTEDGKDIFEGDEYWHIVSDGTAQMENAVEYGREQYKTQSIKRFSSKEAAEAYVAKEKSTQEYLMRQREEHKHYLYSSISQSNTLKEEQPNKERTIPLFTINEIIDCYEKAAPLFSPLFNTFFENLSKLKKQ